MKNTARKQTHTQHGTGLGRDFIGRGAHMKSFYSPGSIVDYLLKAKQQKILGLPFFREKKFSSLEGNKKTDIGMENGLHKLKTQIIQILQHFLHLNRLFLRALGSVQLALSKVFDSTIFFLSTLTERTVDFGDGVAGVGGDWTRFVANGFLWT
jgi:hypothetical protein